ncbi:MarR family winged helix-turn-helix transcriptional regulator [Sediminibacillus massiliensis]|uniref:MarR family winged helix-turn-helix transcriptional regulator n=1 Tax=Sediminibacillus massiliensis TaxID=1926277 RepID=UPI0009883DD9|nr:MarR family transcriptional regulator [Sediminibacillus massiliensis]
MDTSHLFHTLNQKVRMLSKELNEKLQEYNLYSSQWTILYTLDKRGPMTQTDIWNYLKVEAPTVTRTLARMESSGWVTRKPGKDKRERIVQLTLEAEQKVSIIKQSVENFEQDHLAHLSEQERQQLLHLLQKLGK